MVKVTVEMENPAGAEVRIEFTASSREELLKHVGALWEVQAQISGPTIRTM